MMGVVPSFFFSLAIFPFVPVVGGRPGPLDLGVPDSRWIARDPGPGSP